VIRSHYKKKWNLNKVSWLTLMCVVHNVRNGALVGSHDAAFKTLRNNKQILIYKVVKFDCGVIEIHGNHVGFIIIFIY